MMEVEYSEEAVAKHIATLVAIIAELRGERELGFTQRDEVLVALTYLYPSHRMRKMAGDSADWPYLVCVRAPPGEIYFHIAEHRISMFDHLEWREAHWDGSTGKDRTARLALIRKDQR